MTRAGYCFRCDRPAQGDTCPRCGADLYRAAERRSVKATRPRTIGEQPLDAAPGLGLRAVVAIVLVALLLIAIAVVAATTAGVS